MFNFLLRRFERFGAFFICGDKSIIQPSNATKIQLKFASNSVCQFLSPALSLFMVSFCINFCSLPLYAGETARTTITTGNPNPDQLPKLSSYTPMPCVTAGSSLILRGSNFQQLKASRQKFSLAVEINGKHQTIEFQLKGETTIAAVLPEKLENLTSIRIGFLPKKYWQQRALVVKLCSGNNARRRGITLQEDAENLNSDSDSATTTTEIDSQDATQSKPDPVKPDRDTNLATRESNNDLRRRIANRQTAGSLIGSALPPLPPALRLKQANDNSSYVNNELIAVSADSDQAKQLAQIMSGYQARAIRRKTMGALGMVLTTFRLAPGNKVDDILEQLRNNNPEIWIDANHFYFPSSTSNQQNQKNNRLDLFNRIGLGNNQRCQNNVKIGILDGPVNQKVDSLATQSITQKNMYSRGKKSASAAHATAIASLLVGSQKSPQLAGVMSHAELFVGVVMQVKPDDNKTIFTTTESLILGLNWLVEQQVSVINLSLGGPRNALLEVSLNKVLALDIGVVAAAGNSGSKARQSFPAAQPGIIGVSAVDNQNNLAEDATQGDYIELSAPGVDLWVASEKSAGHYLSGSSLAAPLVTAALAQLGGSPKQAVLLFKTSQDLGEPGKDSKYGWGLLQFPACLDELPQAGAP